jgi:hypothetical protein
MERQSAWQASRGLNHVLVIHLSQHRAHHAPSALCSAIHLDREKNHLMQRGHYHPWQELHAILETATRCFTLNQAILKSNGSWNLPCNKENQSNHPSSVFN